MMFPSPHNRGGISSLSPASAPTYRVDGGHGEISSHCESLDCPECGRPYYRLRPAIAREFGRPVRTRCLRCAGRRWSDAPAQAASAPQPA